MNITNLKNTLSIISGVSGAIAGFYVFLAPIWNLPNADKIALTAAGLAVFLTTVLSVFTGQKVVSNIRSNSPTTDELVAEEPKTYAPGNAMSEEKVREEYGKHDARRLM